ncbi:hypothetical protein P9G84_10275 [Brevibacillus centrosporus]|uniref:hypothetical protein n=1 Tax=Brevibacillus centrosporus TaxID=54910 RepID=UPI001144DE08|nr:hypothetical protein [Brevibacillus centrosporus]MEC2129354.1 hypothetical protein [Brevibacillus centrosporus]GED33521.1 hypothetical protein BCE02nite_46620 [Brevibacillus centrosporus]
MKIYDGDKLEALAAFLKIDVDDLQVWSDDSVTVGGSTSIEYYVRKRKRGNREYLGMSKGYHIYRQC